MFNDLGSNIYSCCILSDGRTALTNLLTDSTRVRYIDDSKDSLSCHRNPVDIQAINDDATAVSNDSGGIEIINKNQPKIYI